MRKKKGKSGNGGSRQGDLLSPGRDYMFSSGYSRTKENSNGLKMNLSAARFTPPLGMVKGRVRIKRPVPAIPAKTPAGLANTRSSMFHSSVTGSSLFTFSQPQPP